MRLVVLSALGLWVGSTLLLSELRWFRRRSLSERLRPYTAGGGGDLASGGGMLSVSSFRDLVSPLATSLGSALARLLGVEEPVAARLRRIHDETEPAAFRVRQLGWSGAGAVLGALAATAARLPAVAGLGVVAGAALLGFLLVEQQLSTRSSAWQRSTFLELPVVAEQLGMLLSAGYSLGSAINRVAARGAGCVGRDLRRVSSRVRQGLSEVDALREWAATVDVDAVERLVAVLALNRHAGDLGRLISEEARSIRREVQRELLETIERRSQAVWIPVTVATLLPGVVFLAVPFIEALRVFSGD